MNNELKNILLCTDFSRLADNALATAVSMCRRHGATLHLVHVVENRFLMAPTEMYAAAIYVVPELENIARQKMEQLESGVKNGAGLQPETHLEFGNAADGICDKANQVNADLIVIGTHGASGFRYQFIGSTSYSVIKNTTIPVLTIPGHKEITRFNRILFPLRAQKGIAGKFEFIAPVIEKNNAELLILGLSSPGEPYDMGNVEEEIRVIAGGLRQGHFNYRTDYRVSRNFARDVVNTAKKEKADLIVINASLDYTWRQFFIGPYTQQIIHQSPVPVLNFRTPSAPGLPRQDLKKDTHQTLHFKPAY